MLRILSLDLPLNRGNLVWVSLLSMSQLMIKRFKIIKETQIDQSFENYFEEKLIYLDESIRDVLVSYTPPKVIINPSLR